MRLLWVGGQDIPPELKSSLCRITGNPVDIIYAEVEEAGESAQTTRPDITVLDVGNADNALQLLQTLRALDKHMHILVLMAPGGHGFEETVSQDADGLLLKPYHEVELTTLLAGAVSSRNRKMAEEERRRVFDLSLDMIGSAGFDVVLRK